MNKEWQTFVRNYGEIEEGRRKLFVKDLTPGPRKYDTQFVLATLSKTELPDGGVLWIRGESGLVLDKPWFIRIEEVLPEWVKGEPYENVLDAVAKQS